MIAYKLYYKKENKWKLFRIVHALSLAHWHMQYFVKAPPLRQWKIRSIADILELQKYMHGCPFDF